MPRANQNGNWEDKKRALLTTFLASPLPSLPPLSAVSAQTGRASTVGHSEASFSFHYSFSPPYFLIPPSHPTPFSIPQLQDIPRGLGFSTRAAVVVLGLRVGSEQAGGLAAAEGGPG